MKRPLLVMVLAMGILGTLAAYSQFIASLPAPQNNASTIAKVSGTFAVEISLSCNLAADPFELDQTTSLRVRSAGQDLIRKQEPVTTIEPIRLENLSGVSVGKNAFFVEAIPATESIAHPQALRIRIYRNQQLVADNSLWSAPGESIVGEIVLDVPAETGGQP